MANQFSDDIRALLMAQQQHNMDEDHSGGALVRYRALVTLQYILEQRVSFGNCGWRCLLQDGLAGILCTTNDGITADYFLRLLTRLQRGYRPLLCGGYPYPEIRRRCCAGEISLARWKAWAINCPITDALRGQDQLRSGRASGSAPSLQPIL